MLHTAGSIGLQRPQLGPAVKMEAPLWTAFEKGPKCCTAVLREEGGKSLRNSPEEINHRSFKGMGAPDSRAGAREAPCTAAGVCPDRKCSLQSISSGLGKRANRKEQQEGAVTA